MRTIILLARLCATNRICVAEDRRAIDIGARRELFVDQYLIESVDGVRLQLHHPQPREVSLVHDEPWEGTGTGYHSVFQDGDLYRMYYKAWQLNVKPDSFSARGYLYCCYAESDDGVHWRKPKLGSLETRDSFYRR